MPPVARESARVFEASRRSYGSPRIWKDLVEDGEAVSRKRVVRLMQEDGLRGRVRRAVHADDR